MAEIKPTEVTISNRTVVRLILLTIGTIVAIRFALNVANVLQLIFIAFFLALALNPVVSWLARTLSLKSRVTATGIAYLLVVIVLGAFFALVVPPLVKQTVNFVRDAPDTIHSLKSEESVIGDFIRRYELDQRSLPPGVLAAL